MKQSPTRQDLGSVNYSFLEFLLTGNSKPQQLSFWWAFKSLSPCQCRAEQLPAGFPCHFIWMQQGTAQCHWESGAVLHLCLSVGWGRLYSASCDPVWNVALIFMGSSWKAHYRCCTLIWLIYWPWWLIVQDFWFGRKLFGCFSAFSQSVYWVRVQDQVKHGNVCFWEKVGVM